MSQRRVKQLRRQVRKQARQLRRAGFEDVILLPFWRRVRVARRIITRAGYSREDLEALRAQRAAP